MTGLRGLQSQAGSCVEFLHSSRLQRPACWETLSVPSQTRSTFSLTSQEEAMTAVEVDGAIMEIAVEVMVMTELLQTLSKGFQ